MRIIITCVFSVITIAGCGLLPTHTMISPNKIHLATDENIEMESQIKSYAKNPMAFKQVELVPIVEYYDALFVAMHDSNGVLDYLEKGFSLTDSYCTRWFDKLTDNQMRIQSIKNNNNIFTKLGSSTLGIANANNYIVDSYNAIALAESGYLDSYSEIALLTPDMYKLRSKIFNALDSNKKELRKKNNMSFLDAYSSLEKHASICTYAGAKEITSDSLKKTETVANPDTGELTTRATPEASAQTVSEKAAEAGASGDNRKKDQYEKTANDLIGGIVK
ncbi:MAG: hypothetical protein BWK73_05400 [Thiothrix lacustris]|uniref:Lipoprotein n=1 Tax=Thiothrix lacustris TaxID=525917 RepID=A0A1Y1QXB7_9GAMM|nr:MAG: hypothetical protein BWK73_05400 [Thiothrix lacustris]